MEHGVSTLSDLVDGWVWGWAASRATETPVRYGVGWRIAVGRPGHTVRLVLPECDEATIREVAELETTPGVWLKTCATPTQLRPLLPTEWQIADQEHLMSSRLTRSTMPTAASYAVRVEAEGPNVLDVVVKDENETEAARGRLAVYKSFAVFDQIVTAAVYRRRGLGTLVMARLTELALDRGASCGVLVATDGGCRLYQRLGWTWQSPVTPARYVGLP